jgi:hypothetical protein
MNIQVLLDNELNGVVGGLSAYSNEVKVELIEYTNAKDTKFKVLLTADVTKALEAFLLGPVDTFLAHDPALSKYKFIV